MRTVATRRSRTGPRQAENADARAAGPPAPAPAEILLRCACGGGCPRCRAKAASSASYTSPPALPINQPGDRWEREADRMADAVMTGGVSPSSAASPASIAAPALRRCACGGSCPSCRAKAEAEDHSSLMREAMGGSSSPAVAPPIVHDVLSSSGRPLDAPTRGFMETRFGADFGGVRVHDDGRAAESARAVGAHAYAVGTDVVFGAGRYAPGTREGDRLIAHELAHVLQARGVAGLRIQRRLGTDVEASTKGGASTVEDSAVRERLSGGAGPEPGEDALARQSRGRCRFRVVFSSRPVISDGCGVRGVCGLRVVYRVERIVAEGPGCPPLEGLHLTEDVTSDRGCPHRPIEMGDGCVTGPGGVLPGSCMDDYSLCVDGRTIPQAGCTVVFTQRLFVNGQPAGVRSWEFRLTRSGGRCTAEFLDPRPVGERRR